MPGRDHCARCRGSDCICELIVEVRRLDREASSATMQLQEERGLHNARANRLSELDKERAELTPVLDRVKALLKKVNTGSCTSQTDCAGYSLKCVSCESSDLLGRLARLRPDPARKSGMDPEESSGQITTPSNTAPRVQITSVLLFKNGNSGAFSGQEQVGRLQGNWVAHLLVRMRRLGADFAPGATIEIEGFRGWDAFEIAANHCDCGGKLISDMQSDGRRACAVCGREAT